MTRRLVFLAVFAVLAVAGLGARAADPVEAFLHRWEDPRLFDAGDLDRNFRAEVNGGGQSLVLDRDQTIAYNQRIRQILTSYKLKSFRIVQRHEAGGNVVVTYATAYELKLRGQPVAIQEIATVTLMRGGKNGFRVLSVRSDQKEVVG
ncbi:MAG: hypothetical protein ACM3N5_15770 [Candidatus Eiseniibacteriota bacterium]